MTHISAIIAFVGEIVMLCSAIIPLASRVRKIGDGTKCQLRKEMLHIYYRNRESQKIRQYEYENFVFLYDAYKALKGNSFIDKIYKEIQSWEVIS